MLTNQAIGNGQEVLLEQDDLLVSKTDTRGKVTYANRRFMNISGYYEQHLLGQPHNIIRHADMPRAVFRLMWRMLQEGKEFFGFVKNSCADGRHYWVFANVTVDLDEHGVSKGYFSVRRCPPRSAVDYCEKLYRDMRSIEAGTPGNGGIDKSLAYLQEVVSEQYPSFNEAMLALYNQSK
ncbi:PAS domain-containing protein [Marinomonas ostreistagni]|uniref:PAS domain-containing protein n=1 Tax=Marinomonas ostreistagni TaxID=359209 RepID=UPI001951F36C|nr:PAS domain-containing protein [Marinomonas ostreistagni]MBM6549502.1 PAS domain-containing protein [Marinomonas ostreistagni]